MFAFSTTNSNAQQKFSAEDIRSDIDYMVNLMEHTHVNLYFYYPKAEFCKDINSLKESIKDSLSKIDIWKKTAPIVAKLRDAHTSFEFPEEEINDYIKKGGLIFPFRIKIEGEKVLIENNYSGDQSITSGSEILSINKIPSHKIIKDMLKYICGEKESFRKAVLRYDFISFLLALYNTGNDFNIKYYSYFEKKVKEKIFTGLPIDKYEELSKVTSSRYALKFLENEKIALIDIRSFIEPEKFNEFLKETFKTIKEKKITKLIIDIRKNSGGNSRLGDNLFNYITDKSYIQYARQDVKMSDSLKAKHSEYKEMKTDTIVIETTDKLIIPENPENKFSGDVYLLTDNATFSSAQDFSAAFKCYKMGIIIGEETGGVTVAYGNVLFFTMPKTNMNFMVSTKLIWDACGKEDGKGVIPDYFVKQKREDTAKGIDTVLEYTLSLIKRKLK